MCARRTHNISTNYTTEFKMAAEKAAADWNLTHEKKAISFCKLSRFDFFFYFTLITFSALSCAVKSKNYEKKLAVSSTTCSETCIYFANATESFCLHRVKITVVIMLSQLLRLFSFFFFAPAFRFSGDWVVLVTD